MPPLGPPTWAGCYRTSLERQPGPIRDSFPLEYSLGWEQEDNISQLDIYMTWTDRITFDPAVMGGKPCIRGTRVTVGTIVGLIAAGRPEVEILAAYTYLDTADIRAALAYAAWRSEERDIPLASA